MKDDEFKKPKATVSARIYTADCHFTNSVHGRLFTEIWRDMLSEYLREYTYNAECAELDFSAAMAPDSLQMQWSGYNDSMVAFVTETCKRLAAFQNADSEQIFNQTKEKCMQSYKNHYLQ